MLYLGSSELMAAVDFKARATRGRAPKSRRTNVLVGRVQDV